MAAKPDCDDGWLKYAHELDAALAVADFTKGARIVLREVFAQIYGPAKLRHALLSPSEIGGRVSMARSHVMRGITELVTSGVLIRRDDGSYKFIKDYESWTYKGARRLSEAEIVYCHSAPRMARSYVNVIPQNALPNEVTHQQSPVTNLGNNGEDPLPNEVTDVTNLGNGLLPNEVTGSSPPPAPPLVNGREDENGELRQEIPPLPPEGVVGGGEGSTPSPESGPAEVPGKPDPAIVAGLEGLARVVLGERGLTEDFQFQIEGWLYSFPADWIRDAIYCTGAKAATVTRSLLASYAFACLRRWHPDGPKGKDATEVDAARRRFGERGRAESVPDYKPPTADDIEAVERVKAAQKAKAARRNS